MQEKLNSYSKTIMMVTTQDGCSHVKLSHYKYY